MAVVDTERATPENAQSCFGRLFGEKAFLKKEMMVKYEQYEFEVPLREIIPKLISYSPVKGIFGNLYVYLLSFGFWFIA